MTGPCGPNTMLALAVPRPDLGVRPGTCRCRCPSSTGCTAAPRWCSPASRSGSFSRIFTVAGMLPAGWASGSVWVRSADTPVDLPVFLVVSLTSAIWIRFGPATATAAATKRQDADEGAQKGLLTHRLLLIRGESLGGMIPQRTSPHNPGGPVVVSRGRTRRWPRRPSRRSAGCTPETALDAVQQLPVAAQGALGDGEQAVLVRAVEALLDQRPRLRRVLEVALGVQGEVLGGRALVERRSARRAPRAWSARSPAGPTRSRSSRPGPRARRARPSTTRRSARSRAAARPIAAAPTASANWSQSSTCASSSAACSLPRPARADRVRQRDHGVAVLARVEGRAPHGESSPALQRT